MSTKRSKVFSKRSSNHKSFKSNTRQSRQRMYTDRAWRNYRYRYLNHNPFCYVCSKKATVIDHIVPHKGNKTLFEDVRNHMPLCTRCHNTITTLFDRDYKIGDPIDDKAKWIDDMRKTFGSDRKIKILPYYKG